MIKTTAAHLASSLMLPRNLMCKEEHVAAVKVGTILAEKKHLSAASERFYRMVSVYQWRQKDKGW